MQRKGGVTTGDGVVSFPKLFPVTLENFVSGHATHAVVVTAAGGRLRSR